MSRIWICHQVRFLAAVPVDALGCHQPVVSPLLLVLKK